ncbi:hypothetical protein BDR22DRAFT_823861 [Usnea florida]
MPENYGIDIIMVSSFVKQGIKIEQITFEKMTSPLADETGQRWYSTDYHSRVTKSETERGTEDRGQPYKSFERVVSVGPAEHLLRYVLGISLLVLDPGSASSRLNPTDIAPINGPPTSPQHVEMKQSGSKESHPPLPRVLQGFGSFEANASPSRVLDIYFTEIISKNSTELIFHDPWEVLG